MEPGLVSLTPRTATTSPRPSREGVTAAVLAMAREDARIVVLCADLAESTRFQEFARALPAQFIEVGVAEQNLVGIAAGLARSGMIPVIASYAAFNPGRTYDHLRVAVAYSNLPVKILGSHAGLNVGPDGASHQMLEDLAMMRVLPNLTVAAPADYQQGYAVAQAALTLPGPVYIRCGRAAVPKLAPESYSTVPGQVECWRTGTDVALVSTGEKLHTVLAAADLLAAEGTQAQVLHLPWVKLVAPRALLTALQLSGAVVTCEDAQATGGLGGMLAELISAHMPLPLERVGVHDRFGESGTAEELAARYQVDSAAVVAAARRAVHRKTPGNPVP